MHLSNEVCDRAKCFLKHSASHTFFLLGGKCYRPAAAVLLNIHSAENGDEVQALTNTTELVNVAGLFIQRSSWDSGADNQ